MKKGHNNIITSHWLRSSIILVLLYFSQVYSFEHLHHVHGLLEFEISSHSVVVEGEHLSDHHHDGDHQHKYDKHIDWHILRTRSQQTVIIDDQYIVSLLPFIISAEGDVSYIVNEDILFIDDSSRLSLIIRGPPFFG